NRPRLTYCNLKVNRARQLISISFWPFAVRAKGHALDRAGVPLEGAKCMLALPLLGLRRFIRSDGQAVGCLQRSGSPWGPAWRGRLLCTGNRTPSGDRFSMAQDGARHFSTRPLYQAGTPWLMPARTRSSASFLTLPMGQG